MKGQDHRCLDTQIGKKQKDGLKGGARIAYGCRKKELRTGDKDRRRRKGV